MSFSHKLFSVSQVQDLDKSGMSQTSITEILLMKRAAKVALRSLLNQWPHVTSLEIFCGGGNNGGDGYIIAALAAQKGFSVCVWQLSLKQNSAVKAAKDYAIQEGVTVKAFELEECTKALSIYSKDALLVDALLGSGYDGSLLKESYLSAIHVMNDSLFPVFSIDIPSGVNPDNGYVREAAVQADVTLAFIGQKLGNFIGEGRIKSGRRLFDGLSIPSHVYDELSIEPKAQLLDLPSLLPLLQVRKLDAHKGDFGHVMIVGGDDGYGGAPLMAAQMAARSGAGLVSVATQVNNTAAINARQPEIMAVGVSTGQEFTPYLDRPNVLVVGPGLGQSAWSEQLLYHCLHANRPMVVDADALNILSQDNLVVPTLEKGLQRQWILTPHPGEAARLLGISIDEVQKDRVAAIYSLQRKFGGAVVLKGAGTLVLSSDLKLFVCDAGNPSMASGGMGDVLSGLLGALLAQGLDINEAACLGTILHSHAADLVVEKEGPYGLLASDVIVSVRSVLNVNFKSAAYKGAI